MLAGVKVYLMLPAPSDFAPSMSLDNSLLRQSVVNAEPIPLAEVLNLAALAQAIYISATLESRSLGRVKDCRKLWSGISQLFDELAQSWVDVNCDDPNIRWLQGRLEYFYSAAKDRREMFTVTEKERLKHAKDRGDTEIESFGSRSEREPDGYRSESYVPPHIYQLGHF